MHQAASAEHYLTTELGLKIGGVCSGLDADKAVFHLLGRDFARERFYFSVSALCVPLRACVEDQSITVLFVVVFFPYVCVWQRRKIKLLQTKED